MSTANWIAIYMPLFIVLLVVIPQQNETYKTVINRIKRRKGVLIMTNEMLKKYIGRLCRISTGSLGTNIAGKIIDINENWIEVETKKGNELINAEFVQSIKVVG